jgi:DDE domain
MTSGSNWRHLNKPQTEEARRSIRPACHGLPAKLQQFRRLKPTNDSWRVDETYIRVKDKCRYLYRAVDSSGAPLDFLLSAPNCIDSKVATRPDRKQDHLWFKLAPLEQSGNRWDTEHPSMLAARLSGQAFTVATLPLHLPFNWS